MTPTQYMILITLLVGPNETQVEKRVYDDYISCRVALGFLLTETPPNHEPPIIGISSCKPVEVEDSQ